LAGLATALVFLVVFFTGLGLASAGFLPLLALTGDGDARGCSDFLLVGLLGTGEVCTAMATSVTLAAALPRPLFTGDGLLVGDWLLTGVATFVCTPLPLLAFTGDGLLTAVASLATFPFFALTGVGDAITTSDTTGVAATTFLPLPRFTGVADLTGVSTFI